MSCGSCGSGGCGSGGCGRSGGCATGGCNKLNTYDWLNNMLTPGQTEVDNIYEVRFKNTRKGFYRNVNGLRLYLGDQIVVESDRGYDVGTLSLGGVMAELQMKKKGYRKSLQDVPRIYRKANEKDIELLQEVRSREQETLVRTREIVLDLNLDMKISDIEYQGDNAKAIFYYIADHRVDFRELIKVLAREFRVRVEMKQIGLRHEAGLVGGIGSCGRELCCSTWLTEFKTVSTSAARYQNLSLNPMKISGLCGRLKCCLNFELDSYLDALVDFPKVEMIETAKGKAFLQKSDIFKRKMWFSYINESSWYPLDVEQVKEIAEANQRGEKPDVVFETAPASRTLGEDGLGSAFDDVNLDFVDVVGTDIPKEEPRNRRGNRNRGKNRNNRNKSNRGKGPQGRNQNRNNEGQERKGNNSGPKRQKAKDSGTQKQQDNSQKEKSGNRQPQNRQGQQKGGNNRRRGNKGNQNRNRGRNRNRSDQKPNSDAPSKPE